jgi:hypothetical protein
MSIGHVPTVLRVTQVLVQLIDASVENKDLLTLVLICYLIPVGEYVKEESIHGVNMQSATYSAIQVNVNHAKKWWNSVASVEKKLRLFLVLYQT